MDKKLTNAYQSLTEKYLAGGVHYNFQNPFEVQRIHFREGKGTRIYDLDGNEYIDFFCKFGANILGHNYGSYISELQSALKYVTATSLAYNEYEVSQKICELIPSADRVRYCLSGTEAVQNAIRLARAYTGKKKFLRFNMHYHGSADNIMGGISDDIADPTPHPFHGDTRGTQGRANNVLESQSYLIDWNDEEKLENLLQRKGNEIAAIITEPICVNGQVKFSKSGYLEKVRQLCTKYNILLIFDEVITGFRISLGGAQKYLGIMPDITVLGKALAGGTLPLSAVVGKKDIMDLYTKNKVVHANTFNGYTLGLTAAKATLEILSSNEDVYKYMESQFIKITGAFQQEAKKYNFNINILGHPTCSAFDCSSWDENDRFDSKTLNTVLSRTMLEEGILLSNTTTFYSNISITDDDIELFKSRLPNVFNAAVAKIEKLK